MVIKFKKNPVGMFQLSYEIGEVIDFPDSQAIELIESGYADKSIEKPTNSHTVNHKSEFSKSEKR